MDSTTLTGLLATATALALATLVGVVRARRDGRTRAATGPAAVPVEVANALTRLGVRTGQPVTLLQFSSAVCATCRVARRVAGALAEGHAGVEHLEVDVEHHLDEVRVLDVWRTPTLLVIDSAGRVAHRVSGAPREADLRAAVTALLPAGAVG